ncbi:hypothetical protein AJ87_35810 [Rhizobium yanglingense]|nr:hypothetical protein AJ87_35810 [Rhizobium yanglingense]
MAEADGLMGDIGAWVLEQACREASTWPSHFIVSVNLSPAEFLRAGFTDRITRILDEVGFPADRLELEITETVLLERSTNNLDTLHTLEVLGTRIALDDFGTRYSSLSYLQNFPFDTIKIDKHFINDVETNPKSQTIVRFIIGLAHGLGMRVTAEASRPPVKRVGLAEKNATDCKETSWAPRCLPKRLAIFCVNRRSRCFKLYQACSRPKVRPSTSNHTQAMRAPSVHQAGKAARQRKTRPDNNNSPSGPPLTEP